MRILFLFQVHLNLKKGVLLKKKILSLKISRSDFIPKKCWRISKVKIYYKGLYTSSETYEKFQ